MQYDEWESHPLPYICEANLSPSQSPQVYWGEKPPSRAVLLALENLDAHWL